FPWRRAVRTLRNHPPATSLGTYPDALADALLCDLACSRTTPQGVSGLPPADHPARKSTTVQSWSSPVQVPAPELGCHPHATSLPPSRAAAALRPAASAAGCNRPPIPPAWSARAALPRAHRSLIGGTAAGDRSTSRPARGPTARDRLFLARWV